MSDQERRELDACGRIKRNCDNCGKEFELWASHAKRRKRLFCSHDCSARAVVKRESQCLDGEWFYLNEHHGYFANAKRRMNRTVWEKYHGPIPDGFIVHHKNEIKTDNRIENLEIKEWGEHTREHNSVGVEMGSVTCLHCGITIERKMREIRRGQDKYCSKRCSALRHHRAAKGSYDSR